MSITKKLVIAVVAMAVAMCCMIGGTLAWLLHESNVVTNTFTYGTITIELTESNKTNKTGIAYTNVVPGDELDKDPVVTVKKGSEKCFVYVLITNQLGSAATYNITGDWIKIGEKDNTVLYRYTGKPVDASETEKDLAVFTKLTFSDDLTVKDVAELKDKTVVIKAYAHQSDNTTIDVADDAAIGWAELTKVTTNN